jgi:hypothetical protein
MRRRAGAQPRTRAHGEHRRPAPRARGGLRLLALGLLACAVAPAGATRFAVDSPAVDAIDDTTRIPEPSATGWNLNRWLIDEHWLGPLDDLLTLRGREPAGDINALDQVPACSWFQPRNGRLAMSPRAMARGNAPPSGIPRGALEVQAGRCGAEPFLLVRDIRGDRWILEFDDPERPGMATAAAIVSARLLHAAGYNVLPCRIASIDPAELVLATEARAIGLRGGTGGLDASDLDHLILRVASEPQVRVAASRLPAGSIKGGFRDRGTRGDDPNDAIPHEDRRALRGFLPLAAWLEHPGLRPARTLDLFLEAGGFLRHYLIGLSATMRTLAAGAGEDRTEPVSGATFDARLWRPPDPFLPFDRADHADLYWGLALLLSFDDAQIRAAVSAAELSSVVEAELARRLIARRATVARGYLQRVNAAGAFRLRDEGQGRWSLLCEDAGVAAGVRDPREVLFLMEYAHGDGSGTGAWQARGGDAPAFDLTPFVPAATAGPDDPRRYGVATVQARAPRGPAPRGRTSVHIYFAPDGDPRIVGIERN